MKYKLLYILYVSGLILFLLSSPTLAQTDYWKHAGLSNHGILSIATDLHGHIFAGTGDSGVYRSTDEGQNWINVKSYPDRVEAIAIDSNGFIFVGFYNGLSRSTDDGVSWSDSGSPKGLVQSIYVAPNRLIYAGVLDRDSYISGLIYKSTDNGDHWTNINNGLDSTLPFSILQHSSGDLFVGSMNGYWEVNIPPRYEWYSSGGLRGSTDSGRTWHTLANLGGVVSALKENRQGWMFAGTYGCMYRSIDTGMTWTEINEGLSSTGHQRNVRSFIINPDGNLFIATLAGVFQSTDNGDHWIAINGGLADTNVHSIAIDLNGYVYAGSLLTGVFRSVRSTTSVEHPSQENISSFYLRQNYPNPFNPITTIEFSLPQAGYVTLRVYDILGEEVSVLVNERLPAGVHRVSWNAENRASGLYIVRIQAGKFTQTKKLLLMK